MMDPRGWRFLVLAASAVLLSGCIKPSTPISSNDYLPKDQQQDSKIGSIFGDDGVLGSFKGKSADPGGSIRVNAFLWRGVLDTLSFMPLNQADPFSGIVITDWYQPPAGNGERFKAIAYVLSPQLRADGIKVSIFRQVQQNGQWTDAAITPSTATEIENKVLARARELRSQTAAGG